MSGRPSMRESDVVVRDPEFRLEELDNELLLYHAATTQAFYLNDTASLVWRLCDGERSIREIIALLHQSFPDAGSGLSEQVVEALSTLAAQHVLTFRPAAPR